MAPHELAAKHKIRPYGFHGVSHNYLMLRYAEITGTPIAQTNIITLPAGWLLRGLQFFLSLGAR